METDAGKVEGELMEWRVVEVRHGRFMVYEIVGDRVTSFGPFSSLSGLEGFLVERRDAYLAG